MRAALPKTDHQRAHLSSIVHTHGVRIPWSFHPIRAGISPALPSVMTHRRSALHSTKALPFDNMPSARADAAKAWPVSGVLAFALACVSPGEDTTSREAELFYEADGNLVFEAEHFAESTVGTRGDQWTAVSNPAASADVAMVAAAGSGATYRNITGSPRLSWNVNVIDDATRYVWIRGRAHSRRSDSLHLGIDGQTVESPFHWRDRSNSWLWKRATSTVQVSPGVHRVDVWMREPGFEIDKILVTSDGGFVPTEEGPTESPTGATCDAFEQDVGGDNLVVIEAESFHSDSTGSGSHAWVESDLAGASEAALLASPNIGTNNSTDFEQQSPRVDYRVSFAVSGSQYLWVRGAAASSSDDSLHIGLDDVAVVSPLYWNDTSGTYIWKRVDIDVPSTGHHTLNAWMREDGFHLDKFVITTNADYLPTGTGPGSSGTSCGDGTCNGSEDCSTCPGDCGACTSCGDGTCNGSEDCSTCPGDCGACTSCGDGMCNGGEDCSTCPGDCGACPGQCSPTPGAPPGSPTLGATSYTSAGTTVVSNVIFDGPHLDDLVRVNNGHVVFENVTFRGYGTGAYGHSLEIKLGGSAEVRNCLFEGSPTEDHIQTEYNNPTLIECNTFLTVPGEECIDTKHGESVTIQYNDFSALPNITSLLNHNGTGAVHVLYNGVTPRVFYEDGATGRIVGNEIPWQLQIYDAVNVLVEGNTIAHMKHGEGLSNRDPVETYFLNNVIASASNNGGSCYRDGNSGSDPVSFCTAGAPGWY